jgi:hypothetical protein
MLVYRVGRGRVVVSKGSARPDALVARAVAALRRYGEWSPRSRPLNGFDGTKDRVWTTDFPGGKLVYDERTRETEFVPH